MENIKKKSKLPSKIIKITLFALLVALLVAFLTVKVTSTLKKTIESKVKEQTHKFGLTISTLSINEIGLTSATITNLKIKNSVEIPLLKIHYSIPNLIKKGEVEKITVTGLNVNAILTDDFQLVIKGFENIKTNANSNNKSQNNYKIPTITLDNCNITLTAKKQTFTIPFDFSLTNKDNKFSVYLKTYPDFFNGEVKGNMSDFENGTFKFKLDKVYNQFFIEKLLHKENITLNGDIILKGSVILTNGKLNNLSVTLTGQNYNLNFENTLIVNNFSFNGTSKLSDNFQLSNFTFNCNFEKSKLQNSVVLKDGELQLKGNSINSILFSLNKCSVDLPLKLKLSANGEINNVLSNVEVKGNLNAKMNKGVYLINNSEIDIKKPLTVKSKLTFNNNEISAKSYFNLPNDFSVKGNTVKSNGLTGNLTLKGNTNNLQTFFKFKGKNVKIDSNELKDFKCQNVNLTGKISIKNEKIKRLSGVFRLKNLNLTTTDNIQIENCKIEFPFAQNTNTKNGFFKIGKITTPDIYLTDTKGQLTQISESEIKFQGNGSLPVPSLSLQFNGNVNLKKDNVIFADFFIPETNLQAYTSFSNLSPDLDGLLFKGVIALNGKAYVNQLFDVKSTATLRLNNMFIKDEEDTFSLNNLKTEIEFEDFINFKSKPSAKLTFESAGNETVKITNGLVQFSVINDTSVFVEKTKFNFCGGSVFMSGFFLSPENKNLEIDIYCQKLSLPSLLNTALGEKKAKGSGTVTGIIPIKIANGNISFEKSFLHSVPGETGHLQIEDGKDLTGGVVLAEEAIKNFEYKWARIDFETNNNNLNLILRLDGKPSDKLPLVYDDKIGDFVKDPNNEKHVELQGLKLDLKFVDIDINRLLKEQKRLNIGGN